MSDITLYWCPRCASYPKNKRNILCRCPKSHLKVDEYLKYEETILTYCDGIDQLKTFDFHIKDSFRMEAREVKLPATLVSIPSQYFMNWMELRTIKFDHIELFRLPESLFMGCTSLEEITFPKSLETIGSRCFQGCKNLVSIELPNSILTIGREAFMDCEKLENVNIPENLYKIEADVFNGCSALRSVELSNQVSEIFDGAFANCGNLESIYIHPNVLYVSTVAFINTSEEFVIYMGDRSSVDTFQMLLNKYNELPNMHTCKWIDYKLIGTPKLMELPEYAKREAEYEGGCYGYCVQHTTAKKENKGDYFYDFTRTYSLEDAIDIDLIFATLDGTEYTIPKEEFYNQYSLKEHLYHLHPDKLENVEEFDLLFHCDTDPVQDATPGQMLAKMFDRDNRLDLKEPIMIIWKETD